MKPRKVLVALAACSLVAAASAACSGSSGSSTSASKNRCDGKLPKGTSKLEVWYHQGEQPDADGMKKIAADFNASQKDVQVTLREIPGADYATTVKGAIASGQLPGVLDADASNAFNYAWSGHLVPLDSCIPNALKSDLIPSVVAGGSWAGKQWALGMVDSGMVLYASKKALAKVGARVPTGWADAWTAAEFDQVLAKLKAAGYAHPLDVGEQIGKGEYYSYAFAPIVWSAGGDLINRNGYKTADGSLNSPATVQALTEFQNYFKNGYVDANSDNNAFVAGRSALSWIGFWQYQPYLKALGSDLAVLPLVNYGSKAAGAQGSWQWTITTSSVDPDAAWKWIAYTMRPENVKLISDAASGVPALKSVLASNTLYGPAGGLHLIADALVNGYSVPRPPHPAYSTITSAFSQAIQDVIDGQDVKKSLDTAVATIDDDLNSNDGYPAPKN